MVGSASIATAETAEVTPADHQQVLELWRNGGPDTKDDAAATLTGTDADIREFLNTGKDIAAENDLCINVLRMMSSGGRGMKLAGNDALEDGSVAALEQFVQEGWKSPTRTTCGCVWCRSWPQAGRAYKKRPTPR
ncbi:Short repeat-containing protein of unknown function [Actinopolyspora xinjiangensis]|uniref:Uncharacterized protein n=1 Tax=Actinopolyspora xinjiangensis TaxID=405564 RepID=A0A1H0WCX4_9ACTN|nr:ALF repeat-containing protein [Actinopolyspora xinjiangensis]SDP88554.1 Short repeat-containing protein of unknown function [Actinopolyspora xinjiangensis]